MIMATVLLVVCGAASIVYGSVASLFSACMYVHKKACEWNLCELSHLSSLYLTSSVNH